MEDRFEVFETLSEYQQNIFNDWVNKADFAKVGQKTTVCLLTISNGFEVIGTSACVDPKMFDATLGKEYSLKDALRQLDGYVGFYRQEMGIKNGY